MAAGGDRSHGVEAGLRTSATTTGLLLLSTSSGKTNVGGSRKTTVEEARCGGQGSRRSEEVAATRQRCLPDGGVDEPRGWGLGKSEGYTAWGL